MCLFILIFYQYYTFFTPFVLVVSVLIGLSFGKHIILCLANSLHGRKYENL
jgi:F0F1-type ATP synthase assembly protein I